MATMNLLSLNPNPKSHAHNNMSRMHCCATFGSGQIRQKSFKWLIPKKDATFQFIPLNSDYEHTAIRTEEDVPQHPHFTSTISIQHPEISISASHPSTAAFPSVQLLIPICYPTVLSIDLSNDFHLPANCLKIRPSTLLKFLLHSWVHTDDTELAWNYSGHSLGSRRDGKLIPVLLLKTETLQFHIPCFRIHGI